MFRVILAFKTAPVGFPDFCLLVKGVIAVICRPFRPCLIHTGCACRSCAGSLSVCRPACECTVPVYFHSRSSLLTTFRASHIRSRRAFLACYRAYANPSKEKYPYAINLHRGIFCFEKCTKQCPCSATKSLRKYSYSANTIEPI